MIYQSSDITNSIFKVNGLDLGVGKYTEIELERLNKESAIVAALQNEEVHKYVGSQRVVSSNFVLYSGCEAVMSMFLEKREKPANRAADEQQLKIQ